jgi:hypothetical protein
MTQADLPLASAVRDPEARITNPLRRRRAPGMVENTPVLNILTHLILLTGMIILLFPMYLVFNAATLS